MKNILHEEQGYKDPLKLAQSIVHKPTFRGNCECYERLWDGQAWSDTNGFLWTLSPGFISSMRIEHARNTLSYVLQRKEQLFAFHQGLNSLHYASQVDTTYPDPDFIGMQIDNFDPDQFMDTTPLVMSLKALIAYYEAAEVQDDPEVEVKAAEAEVASVDKVVIFFVYDDDDVDEYLG
jgi:hypothetical protein